MVGVMRVEVQRRFSDLDPLGHINNVVYLDYMQEARVAFLAALRGGLPAEWTQVVVTNQITYKKPLHLSPEPAIVEIWVPRVGGASYDFSYRVLDEHGVETAVAHTVMANFDPDTESAQRIPEPMREKLIAAMDQAREELEGD